MLAKVFEVTQVRSEDELREVGEFRYRCYLAEGAIAPREDEEFVDEFDRIENAHIHAIRSAGRIVGTIRLHILDRYNHSSATMSAFSDVLMPKIMAGQTLIDGARFAVDPNLGSMRLPVARQALRLCMNYERTYPVQYGVAAVPQSRVPLYNRLYGFEQLSAPRPYAHLNKELTLIGVELQAHQLQALAS
ncbi:N-acyl amino acid synthase FeeM domain-containing protein [Pelagovum pacificum]|uniref:N-acyl amino acid synthase FeeM catalytic core domain-containing protein n=1 Tax=Pelagovum pacificum TaxID=2588711 RepID=A0A5C5GG30_9RHOB|nr:acyl-homoserine-lactone synthase [Pelagovum pacificum]QQA43391.1 hypothetical protein I8N54_02120 [Pelagovum pacificum]TNY33470.1 hypothetical protein FHY64_09410 [Pelagovum pacificum]